MLVVLGLIFGLVGCVCWVVWGLGRVLIGRLLVVMECCSSFGHEKCTSRVKFYFDLLMREHPQNAPGVVLIGIIDLSAWYGIIQVLINNQL